MSTPTEEDPNDQLVPITSELAATLRTFGYEVRSPVPTSCTPFAPRWVVALIHTLLENLLFVESLDVLHSLFRQVQASKELQRSVMGARQIGMSSWGIVEMLRDSTHEERGSE